MNPYSHIISTRTLTIILGLIVLATLAFAIPSCLQKQRSQAAQARLDVEQGKAAENSAGVAVGTVAGRAEADATTEAIGDRHEQVIRAAPGNAPIAPAVNRAGRLGMCDYRANRNKPECVVR